MEALHQEQVGGASGLLFEALAMSVFCQIFRCTVIYLSSERPSRTTLHCWEPSRWEEVTEIPVSLLWGQRKTQCYTYYLVALVDCSWIVLQVAFSGRVKNYSVWQSALATLGKKKESEQKLQIGGKPEKLAQVQQEIREVRAVPCRG